jgi:hypothetical protein
MKQRLPHPATQAKKGWKTNPHCADDACGKKAATLNGEFACLPEMYAKMSGEYRVAVADTRHF